MNLGLDRVAREIGDQLRLELDSCGIMCRVFNRVKDRESVLRKVKVKDYSRTGRKMQDLIGVRVAFYFADDLPIIYSLLRRRESYVEETVDASDETVFKPTRINMIFALNELSAEEVNVTIKEEVPDIDSTYEVQLRTVLSEGWHEVEHDLRYKVPDDWENCSDLSRVLNGVYASLVTNDWAMLAIFEDLAYRCYKRKNWSGMIRNKFRIRLGSEQLAATITELFDRNPAIAKSVFRVERNEFLRHFILLGERVPLTQSNIVYLVNALFIKNQEITALTPQILRQNKVLFP